MATVLLNAQARKDLDGLPLKIHGRVLDVIEALQKWPAVSGVKPLRHGLVGQYRKRTGDYRVQFSVAGDVVTITKVGHRDGFYEE